MTQRFEFEKERKVQKLLPRRGYTSNKKRKKDMNASADRETAQKNIVALGFVGRPPCVVRAVGPEKQLISFYSSLHFFTIFNEFIRY